MKANIALILLIAGSGSRMNSEITKQMMNLGEEKIFVRSLSRFVKKTFLSEIILVCRKDEINEVENLLRLKFPDDKIRTVFGGDTRQDSVFNGLSALDSATDIVLIHDGARPFVSDRMLAETEQFSIELISDNKDNLAGGIFAVPVKDTIKSLKNGALENIPREGLYMAQTPQIFLYSKIMEGYKRAKISGLAATDDSMMMEEIGERVVPLMGEYYNIKITSPEDIMMGEMIIKKYF